MQLHRTSPVTSDTDGDGISDGVEVTRGTNPLVAEPGGREETPLPLAPISSSFAKSGLTAGAAQALDAIVAQLKLRLRHADRLPQLRPRARRGRTRGGPVGVAVLGLSQCA